MDDKTNTRPAPYRMPEDFDPLTAADAVRGLTDAIHSFMTEGPGTEAVVPRGDQAGMLALLELLQVNAQGLHDYLLDIENRTTLELPRSEADFERLHVRHSKDEVREMAAVYSIR